MVLGKRELDEFETSEFSKDAQSLDNIRNMWEFANLLQWIYLFGRAVKIGEEVNIEYIESECFKSDSTVLSDIGLALLKFVSSHRGLTPEIFDEYTRRQYVAKAPLRNPFGSEEEPLSFSRFDVVTKIKVLQQLTQWTMVNSERIRERMKEQKDTEQTIWRSEKFGLDSESRAYFVLADKRLYRLTHQPINPPKQNKNAKKTRSKKTRRVSKRIKAEELEESEERFYPEGGLKSREVAMEESNDINDMKWECIAVTLTDYNSFLASCEKSRDPNEKKLRNRITTEILPDLQKHLEAQQRKQAQKERELLNLQKLAFAKRSSRIASKLEQRKQQEEIQNIKRNKTAEIELKEVLPQTMTREQRLKQRETRRILHKEELTISVRGRKHSLEKEGVQQPGQDQSLQTKQNKQIFDKTAEDDWIFDCVCGAYGQIDDGSHSIACDKCSTWQHSKCAGVSKSEANRSNFSFVCTTCLRRADDRERAKNKPPITIRICRQPLLSTPTSHEASIFPKEYPNSGSASLPNSNIKNSPIDQRTLCSVLSPGESETPKLVLNNTDCNAASTIEDKECSLTSDSVYSEVCDKFENDSKSVICSDNIHQSKVFPSLPSQTN